MGGNLPLDGNKFKHFKHSHDQNDNLLLQNFLKIWDFVMQNEEDKFGITHSIQTIF